MVIPFPREEYERMRLRDALVDHGEETIHFCLTQGARTAAQTSRLFVYSLCRGACPLLGPGAPTVSALMAAHQHQPQPQH